MAGYSADESRNRDGEWSGGGGGGNGAGGRPGTHRGHASVVPPSRESAPGSIAGPVAGVIVGAAAATVAGVVTSALIGYGADVAVRHIAASFHGQSHHADVVVKHKR